MGVSAYNLYAQVVKSRKPNPLRMPTLIKPPLFPKRRLILWRGRPHDFATWSRGFVADAIKAMSSFEQLLRNVRLSLAHILKYRDHSRMLVRLVVIRVALTHQLAIRTPKRWAPGHGPRVATELLSVWPRLLIFA